MSALPGNSAPLAELMPQMRSGGVAAVSEVGVLGDPTTATAEEGARIFAEMVDGCCGALRALDTGPGRDADVTGPRLPDGFAVQVDRRVKVLGEGSALLGGSPTRLLRLAPAAQTMLTGGRLEVHDAVSAQLARTLLDATVAHPRPASGPSHRDVTVVIPVRDNLSGVLRLVAALRGMRVVVVDDGSVDAGAAERLRRYALRRPGAAALPQQGARRRRATPAWPRATPTSWRSSTPTWCRGAGGWRRCSATSAIPPSPWSRRGSSACGSPTTWWPATRRCARRSTWACARRRWCPTARCPTCPAPPSSAAARSLNGTRRLRRDAEVRRGRRPLLEVHRGGRPAAYEPIALVAHDHRTQMREWFARKAFYGESAAPLSVRHPGKTAPLVISGWTLVVWILLAMGSGIGYLASMVVAGAHRPPHRQLAEHGRDRTQGSGGGRRARPVVRRPAAGLGDLSALLAASR